MNEQEGRKLRHDIRGCMHGLQLCLSALETPLGWDEAPLFLDDVIKAATRMDNLMEQLDQIPDGEPE